jgi:hypothetical protein
MFKYSFHLAMLLCFNVVLPGDGGDNEFEKYIQKELIKDTISRKKAKIFESGLNTFKSIKNAENPTGVFDFTALTKNDVYIIEAFENPMASNNSLIEYIKTCDSISNDTSDEAIEKIIEANDDCLQRLSKTEQFGLKTLLGCLKHSILLNINS